MGNTYHAAVIRVAKALRSPTTTARALRIPAMSVLATVPVANFSRTPVHAEIELP